MSDVERELRELTEAFFRSVSFERGGSPQYGAIRALFVDGGRLIRNIGDAPEFASVEEFIESRQALVASGELEMFSETEASAITELYGGVAHRWSTYDKAGVSGGVAFEARGLISTQFVRTPDGWRMTSMAWDDERPGNPISPRYLP
ncbi:MAG: hypothetical protein AUI14_23435 [Actinobacteria bacterium 13_2_20CM_2_71_6]|nr:MAG: hypothetical protein AUI14_23435 [Actinobacteria bacterium 13_2_20CM_2_71_6]